MIFRAPCAALLAALTMGCVAASQHEPLISDGRYTMGTVFEITLQGLDASAAAQVLDELYETANRLDRLLSSYEPESEISRLNRTAGRGLQRVDPDVEEILELSLAYSKLTRGAFDVTIGPAIALWMQAAERDEPPNARELSAVRELVGSDLVAVVAGEGVSLAKEGVRIDLGGIAKGFAIDRMLPLLERHAVENALLNFGQSSAWAIGAPAGAEGWRLLVRGPEGRFAGLITLRDQALSVSGSQGQWVEIGGRRYGHIIDPRSGEPLMRARQALVVSRRASLAEALSLALLVLDADVGLALVAAQPDCEGLLIESAGTLRSTPGWDAAVRFEPLARADGALPLAHTSPARGALLLEALRAAGGAP